MSQLWSKKTSVADTDERNIIILHRKIVNIEPIYGVYCSVWRRYICYLSILYWGCLDGVMDKDVRRCIARRARRIRGFNPHRSRKIYMDYVSTVVEKDMRRCYSERNIIILHRKIVNIEPIYGVYCSVWRRYICFLNILYRRCLDGVMVKDVAHAAFVGSTLTEVEIIIPNKKRNAPLRFSHLDLLLKRKC